MRVIGHAEPIKQIRQSGVNAFILKGNRGIGKRTTAVDLALQALGRDLEESCLDLLMVEPTISRDGKLIPLSEADDTKNASIRIEQIRQLNEQLTITPLQHYHVVIDQADLLTVDSANALLKAIEESGATFYLICEGDRLLNTIQSRCIEIPFHPLTPAEMVEVLERVKPEVLLHSSIVAEATGSPGKAIELYDIFAHIGTLGNGLAFPHLSNTLILSQKIAKLPSNAQLWLMGWIYRLNSDGAKQICEEAQSRYSKNSRPHLVWEYLLAQLLTKAGISSIGLPQQLPQLEITAKAEPKSSRKKSEKPAQKKTGKKDTQAKSGGVNQRRLF